MITDHPFNNVTENIFTKIGANLHRRPDHPICIIKEAIYRFFDERHPGVFSKLDDSASGCLSLRGEGPLISPACQQAHLEPAAGLRSDVPALAYSGNDVGKTD